MIVHEEATSRGYNFNREKVNCEVKANEIDLTQGQLEYEHQHLLNKLKIRDPQKHKEVAKLDIPDIHPSFRLTTGEIEDWEIL